MRTVLLGTIFIAAGCVEPVSDEAPSSHDQTLREQLARGATFDLATADASVRATFHRADGPDEAVIALDVTGGTIDAWAYEDTLSLSAVFDLAPILLPSELQPGDLSLVDVRVSVDATCAATWTDAASCATAADVVVSWSLASANGVHPLGDLVIDDLALSATVDADGLTLSGDAPGSRWSWAGVFELGDVVVDVTGSRD